MDTSKQILYELLSNQNCIMLALAELDISKEWKVVLADKAIKTADLIDKLDLLGR